MSVFDAEFLAKVPDQPTLALKIVCKRFSQENAKIPSEQEPEHYEFYLESLALLEILTAAAGIGIGVPSIGADKKETIQEIKGLYSAIVEKIEKDAATMVFEGAKKRFAGSLNIMFAYEFSEGDLAKLQSLIDKLRKQIQAVKGLDADHRKRLLSRLEQLQRELHKRVSDLDRFWGLVGEAGIIVGKLGEQAKPIIECVKLIADIVWSTQARAESLPSTMPNVLQLDSGEKTKESNN